MSGNNNNNNVRTVKESILLGSGHCYCIEATEGEYDLSTQQGVKNLVTALETEQTQLAHIKGGATYNYTVNYYTASDDLGETEKIKMTEDSASLKLGMIATINQSYLQKLFPTVERDASDENFVITRMGGVNNDDGKVYFFAFINEDTDGDTIVIVKGKNTAALSEQFQAANETTLEAEIAAKSLDKNGRKAILVERVHGAEITVPSEELNGDGDGDNGDEEEEPIAFTSDVPE